MFGYDNDIIYKKGKDNVVADAFSRKYEDDDTLLSLLAPILDWLDEDHQEWLKDVEQGFH